MPSQEPRIHPESAWSRSRVCKVRPKGQGRFIQLRMVSIFLKGLGKSKEKDYLTFYHSTISNFCIHMEYGSTVAPICFHIDYDCFCPLVAELSSCNPDETVASMKLLVPYRKRLLGPGMVSLVVHKQPGGVRKVNASYLSTVLI